MSRIESTLIYNCMHERWFHNTNYWYSMWTREYHTFLCPTDSTDAFKLSASKITLQPNETSATINITVLDDWYPENNKTYSITGSAEQYGRYQYSVPTFTFTIQDNDCKWSSVRGGVGSPTPPDAGSSQLYIQRCMQSVYLKQLLAVMGWYGWTLQLLQ